MILDFFIGIITTIVNVLLFPLEVINVAVDFLSGIPAISSFLECVAYVLPWDNIMPLIVLIFGVFSFRAIVSLIKTIWQLIPGQG